MNASAEESGLVFESRKHKSFLGTETSAIWKIISGMPDHPRAYS